MKKLLLLLSCLLLLASCSSNEAADTLNVYNWGEYISDGSQGSVNVNKEFEKYYFEKHGRRLKLNYTTYASNEDMYNKLKSGGVSYDLVIPSDYMIEKMLAEGMLEKLDFSNIPNYAYIDEQYKNASYDPTSEYTVPYTCGYVGIIYNSALAEVDTRDWDCLWDEAYSGQILQFNNPRDAFATAMYSLGIDANTTDEGEWRRAMELLKKQKPLVQSYVMDEIFNKMKNGSAAVAPYYAGDYLTMYADNPDLRFFYPESGTNIFVDAMCIPTCAKNKAIAEEYINFCLSEEIAVANAEYVCYASPNVLVRENADYIANMSELCENAMEILYPKGGIKASYFKNLSPETNAVQNALWEELKIDNAVEAWVYVFASAIALCTFALFLINFISKKHREKFY